LYRVARAPGDPFDLPAWDRAGDDGTFGNRFDDPGATLGIPEDERYRVLYGATQREAALGEVSARFRLDPRLLQRLARIADDDESIHETLHGLVDPDHPDHGLLGYDWLHRRLMGHTVIESGTPFVDIAHADSLAHLNAVLAPLLDSLNLRELDLGSVTGPSRRLTHIASRYIYSRGFAGIRYVSRLGANWECWALFEGRYRHATGFPSPSSPVAPDDADLGAVAKRFGLSIELMRGMGHYLRPWQEGIAKSSSDP
jgi:hypothetical protein